MKGGEGGTGGNVVDLSCLVQFLLPIGWPFIERLFVDAGSGRSWVLGFVGFDLADAMEQFRQDDQGLFGMCGRQQGDVARETHEGVPELRLDDTLRSFDRLGRHGKGGERAHNHTPDQDGEEFLTDVMGGAIILGLAWHLLFRRLATFDATDLADKPQAQGKPNNSDDRRIVFLAAAGGFFRIKCFDSSCAS